jgi:hypothetical protein
MGSQQSIQPTPSLISIPSNYPHFPTPGKLQILWEGNSKSLYHRLSPYVSYDQNSGLIKGFTIQPYWYVYPDENKKGLNALKRYESRVFPIGSAPIDVVRTAKFLGSGNGIIFLGKQFLLQTGNPYNETRIYNPSSPIVAAGMGLAFNTVRPNRAFDTSAGLAGVAGSLLGGLGSAIFGKSINPPAGTKGGALPLINAKSGGKGLLRAGTAIGGVGNVDAMWKKKQGFGFIKSLFANFIPQRQDENVKYRSDEGTYGKMIADANFRLWMDRASPTIELKSARTPPFQMWVAGGTLMRKDSENVKVSVRQFGCYMNEDGMNAFYATAKSIESGRYIPTVGHVGYERKASTNELKPGIRYSDNIGERVNADYDASDIMYNYSFYADPPERFLTKRSDTDIVRTTNLQMTKLLNKIKETGVYDVTIPDGARVITSNQQSDSPAGYDRLFKTAEKGKSPMNYPLGVLKDYRTSRVVDDKLTTNPGEKSLKLPTAGRMDALNTLTVLGKDQKVPNSLVKGWTKWQPYVDDQIAFFFYDVVNEKYIPFRCTVKGLNESLAASWEDMQFIGRGDKVYSYGGFTRNLSFGMKIVIGSIIELAPTWQRINYLATLVKPANYTFSQQNQSYNRFMVPPMVMLTLGDMYKDHPILINSINIVVPDDAAWETQHQVNNEQWEYLASFIKSKSALKFGQLPREIEISVGAVLLEKERAIVGGANFGHAPRQDDNPYRWNTDAVLSATQMTPLDKSLVVTKDNATIYSDDEAAAQEREFS